MTPHIAILRAAIFLLALASISTSAHAGAWLQSKGHGQLISQATYYTTDTFFDANAQEQPQPRFSKHELQPYFEYGATDWLTLGGSAYLQTVRQSGSSNYGLADPELFGRLRLWQNDQQVISIQPLVKLRSSFRDDGPPRGGSKSTDAELSLLYGRNLNLLGTRDYLDLRAGYRMRNHGLSDQLRGDVALGLNLYDSITIIPALRAITSTDANDSMPFSEGGDLDYSLLKTEITGIYRLNERQALQASLFKHVAGKQTGDGYGISIGFAQQF